MLGGYPDGFEQATLGLGCFWGAERIFWKLDGVHTTSVGYGGGTHPSPDYKLVCSGATGHVELVHVVFVPSQQKLSPQAFTTRPRITISNILRKIRKVIVCTARRACRAHCRCGTFALMMTPLTLHNKAS